MNGQDSLMQNLGNRANWDFGTANCMDGPDDRYSHNVIGGSLVGFQKVPKVPTL